MGEYARAVPKHEVSRNFNRTRVGASRIAREYTVPSTVVPMMFEDRIPGPRLLLSQGGRTGARANRVIHWGREVCNRGRTPECWAGVIGCGRTERVADRSVMSTRLCSAAAPELEVGAVLPKASGIVDGTDITRCVMALRAMPSPKKGLISRGCSVPFPVSPGFRET